MAKASKDSENYRAASSKTRCCAKCAHMLSNGGCEIVTGKVDPDYVCDEFTPEAVKTSGPYVARVLMLARRDTPRMDRLFGPRETPDADQYDERLARDRIADRIPVTWGHDQTPGPEGRTRDYTRVERGREERVSGHIQSALKAHMLAQHPGVYPYLQEGRDLEQLDELHHTDHERHNMNPTHHYEPPDTLEHPGDHIIGDVSRSDINEGTGQHERSLITGERLPSGGRLTGERSLITGQRLRSNAEPVPFDEGPQDSERTGLIKHLISAHGSPADEWAGMDNAALHRLDGQYHAGHVFRPGERGS